MSIIGSDLSLYFHIPFCKKKCPYCSFYSIGYNSIFENNYLKAIKLHLDIYKSILKKSNLVSIYFGGGTPSCINPLIIEKILETINPNKNVEITIEINPEDITYKKIAYYKHIKINRISIGAQSFDDKLLKNLKRRHDSKKVKEIIYLFHEKFENISIDLMYDIIKQDFNSWKNTLNEIKNLPIKHISLYNLTFEKNTPFFKNKKKLMKYLPSEKKSLLFLNMALDSFEKNGFKRYEISAFAKKKFKSKHNLGYWQGRDFLGFGPSAFSYFNKKRFKNISNLDKYTKALKEGASYIDFEEKLNYPKNINELLAINLRVINGVNIYEFEKKFGKIPTKTYEKLKKSILVDFNKNKVKLSKKGLLFYDLLASDII